MSKKKRNADLEIAAANAELKRFGVRLRVELQKNCSRLNLRGPLPPKSGDGPMRTQRISLGVGSSAAGIEYAKEQAMKYGLLLDQQRFSWDSFDKPSGEDTCAEAIAKFKRDWMRDRLDRVKASERADAKVKAEKLFKKSFWHRGFSKLPPNLKLDEGVLRTTLAIGWKANTAGQRIAAQNLSRLARSAGIEIDLQGGGYGIGSVKRNIPSDDAIATAIDGIVNVPSTHRYYPVRDGWQWVAGMMATYNLRDHEAFACEVEWRSIEGTEYLVCIVADESDSTLSGRTKTGGREILPLPAEWVERWDLGRKRLPNVTTDKGDRVSTFQSL